MSDANTPEPAVDQIDQIGETGEADTEAGGATGAQLLDRPRRPRPPLVPHWVPIAAGVAIAAIVVVIVALIYSGTVASVSVPKVTGLELGVAKAHLAQNRLDIRVVERRFSMQPADMVLSQSPSAGTDVHRGDVVDVVVSAGTEEFSMPDVVGNGLLLARGTLESKGLEVRVETQPSEQPSDTVLATSPSAGSSVRTGDIVRVTVAATGVGSSTLLPLDMQGVVVRVDPAPVPAGQIDVPLEVARRLRSLVEASGGSVASTRSLSDTGTAAAAPARAKRAKEGSATASVGLTVAASGSGGLVASSPATGTPPIVVPSTRLASQIAAALAAAGLNARASTTTTDAVLMGTSSPWVRLQLGSWTARDDVSSFRDPAWADSVARAIYRSLADLYGHKTGTP